MDSSNILLILNTALTPVSLILSIVVALYALKALNGLTKPSNRPVAGSLVGIGLTFFLFSFFSFGIYFLPLMVEGDSAHTLSSLRSLFTNIAIQVISILLIRIFRNEI